MSTITKEWLQQKIAEYEANRDELPFGLDTNSAIELQAFKLALASLEAEPAIHRWRRVTSEPYGPYPWHYGDFIGFSKPVDGIEDEYFYSAPPEPAMLQGAENVRSRCTTQTAPVLDSLPKIAESRCSNSPVIPGGWVACSERMPVENDIVLVVDDGYFVCEAQYREGDFYSAVRGGGEFFETTCRDVELWMPLPAAPQQEVKP